MDHLGCHQLERDNQSNSLADISPPIRATQMQFYLPRAREKVRPAMLTNSRIYFFVVVEDLSSSTLHSFLYQLLYVVGHFSQIVKVYESLNVQKESVTTRFLLRFLRVVALAILS